ncbi:hypothetical protein KQI68_07200 [Peptoniphilus sp. MSJ-1]|uniref:Uncharacterized protein n=1 Tax=Peptoniphilus ovalis TaxID=2841503 RepID=A0ABS6FHH9_9FIRM|nr:hypothetical protein [Peptoniphilus ovalis]MBU5669625.1 hypothetical protein [Peptoniphilus ovalis]
MTITQLKRYAKLYGYELEEDMIFHDLRNSRQFGTNLIRIDKDERNVIFIENNYCVDNDLKMISKAIQFAETPIENRGELRYYVPLPHLKTSDGEQQYLTHKDNTWFASRRNEELRQTWKKKDLKYIPEEYKNFVKPYTEM